LKSNTRSWVDYRAVGAHGYRLACWSVRVASEFLERHLKRERLADGLNAEFVLRVFGTKHCPSTAIIAMPKCWGLAMASLGM
jgi:hypothetical protein